MNEKKTDEKKVNTIDDNELDAVVGGSGAGVADKKTKKIHVEVAPDIDDDDFGPFGPLICGKD